MPKLYRVKQEFNNLVNKVLDNIPEDKLIYGTVCDPEMGGGQFMIEVERRKREAGLSEEQIANTCYGFVDTQSTINFIYNKYKLVGSYLKNTILNGGFGDMRFDVVLGNPPYGDKSCPEMHQMFFNWAVDNIVDGGTVAFIQPATPYYTNNINQRKENKTMQDNARNYKTSVHMLMPNVFKNAVIQNHVAISVLKKENNDDKLIRSWTTHNNDTYYNVDMKYINLVGSNPVLCESILKKLHSVIDKKGCMINLIAKDPKEPKLYLARILGDTGSSNFHTFFLNSTKTEIDTENEFGFSVKDQTEYDSMSSYLKTYIARFALATNKFNKNLNSGVFRNVPIVDFSQQWSDNKLIEFFGLNEEEYAEIRRVIPRYHKDVG
jgi:hypothetical protein